MVLDERYSKYGILNVILYSKTLCKLHRYNAALELLQEKYIENPSFIQFLYYFGKICIKSDRTKLQATGLGALREVKRFVKNNGKVFYLLGIACFSSGRIYQAHKYFLKANVYIDPHCKLAQKLKKKIKKTSASIRAINEISRKTNSGEEIDESAKEMFFLNYPYAHGMLKLMTAKSLIKSQNLEAALEVIQGLNCIEAYTMLSEFICSGLEYEKANQIMYCALNKLKHRDIPTYEMVAAIQIYCKFLLKHKRVEKSLLILKSLLKLHPDWKIKVPYCSQIQHADSINDLIRNESKGSLQLNDYCLSREFIYKCIDPKNNFTDDVSELSFIKRSIHNKTSSLETLMDSSADGDDFLLSSMYSPRNREKFIADFSIYTNPDILLTIGKVASRLPRFHGEAIQALTDFLALSVKLKKRIKAKRILSSLTS